MDPYGATNYELHYSDGGHSGQYQNYREAFDSAVRLLRGRPKTHSIEIRIGVAGPLVACITQEQVWKYDKKRLEAERELAVTSLRTGAASLVRRGTDEGYSTT